jgi:hypothetical protein
MWDGMQLLGMVWKIGRSPMEHSIEHSMEHSVSGLLW